MPLYSKSIPRLLWEENILFSAAIELLLHVTQLASFIGCFSVSPVNRSLVIEGRRGEPPPSAYAARNLSTRCYDMTSATLSLEPWASLRAVPPGGQDPFPQVLILDSL